MSEEILDVNSAEEQPASDSSAENNAAVTETESSSEDVKTPEQGSGEKTVPYARFKEVNEQRKTAQDMLKLYEQQQKPASQAQGNGLTKDDFSTQQAWQEYIRTVAAQEATAAAQKAQENVLRTQEVNEIMKEPDFPLFADAMKNEIANNPTLSPREALMLAKAKSGVYESQIKQKVEQQVKQDIAQKQKANVGQTAAREQKANFADPNLIFERDNRGAYKYSLSEIEEMLKNSGK